MRHSETNWKTHDGHSIYAQSWEPDNQIPKAVVCLVHGIGEHTSRYVHVAEVFTREGYVFFGADLRGHGRSKGSPGHFPSVGEVIRDVDLLLEHAQIYWPGLPLVLYGHSLGGIIVLYYGLKRNPAIAGVISTSSGLHNALEKQPLKVLAAKVLGALIPAVSFSTGLDATALSRDGNIVQAYKNDPLVHERMSLGFGRIMHSVTRWVLNHADEFSLPLLLLHGTSDTIAFPSGSIGFAAHLDGKCTLVLREGAFHELHNELGRDEVLKTMTEWTDALLNR